ncbi:hypothetical protein EON68_00100 [archaeon]|nr:MAG: hypothetical protein EON68_00100 [archaeon]
MAARTGPGLTVFVPPGHVSSGAAVAAAVSSSSRVPSHHPQAAQQQQQQHAPSMPSPSYAYPTGSPVGGTGEMRQPAAYYSDPSPFAAAHAQVHTLAAPPCFFPSIQPPTLAPVRERAA